jgi:hypothetical protein
MFIEYPLEILYNAIMPTDQMEFSGAESYPDLIMDPDRVWGTISNSFKLLVEIKSPWSLQMPSSTFDLVA